MDHYNSGVIYATSSYTEGAVVVSGIYDIARSTDWGLTWTNISRVQRLWGSTNECGVGTVRTITSYVDQGETPALWEWHDGWTLSDGTTPVDHGADHDENIVAEMVYDAQGRVLENVDHRVT